MSFIISTVHFCEMLNPVRLRFKCENIVFAESQILGNPYDIKVVGAGPGIRFNKYFLCKGRFFLKKINYQTFSNLTMKSFSAFVESRTFGIQMILFFAHFLLNLVPGGCRPVPPGPLLLDPVPVKRPAAPAVEGSPVHLGGVPAAEGGLERAQHHWHVSFLWHCLLRTIHTRYVHTFFLS